MNTAIANLIVLTAAIADDKIAGTAIDGDIKVNFAVAASELNQRLFVPEANLLVSGKFRLGRDVCSVGISIKSVVAVISLPVAASSEVATPSEVATAMEVTVVEPVAVPSEAPAKKRKASTTRSKKQAAKTELLAA